MKKQLSWGWVAIFLTLLIPLISQAQTAPQLNNLSVEIWPEFDKPETLIIYRAELNQSTALPAQVTFLLPGYIESMHAVAVEQNGGLIDVPAEAMTMSQDGDTMRLTFSTPSPKIQLEYYDPVILSKNNADRELAFNFTAPYNTEAATFQVQQPAQATNFLLTPAANRTFTGQDGLTYHNVQMPGLASNEAVDITATYSRPTDALSIEQITLSAPPPPIEAPSAAPPAAAQSINWGYVLIGAGVLLLIIVGGYWWWSQRPVDDPAPRRPAQKRRRRKDKPQATVDSSPEASGGYCYKCGTALRADAQFCHSCGAERRS